MINVITQPLVFCDVETTGGNPRRHRITEIAAIRYENGKEISRINTLVNPHQDIPFNIQIITNINNIMTDSAPDFNEISDKISEIFDGATLVAHHSRFDFSFIQAEMERAGHRFNPKQICTAKLSRRLYPHHRGHGLSNIIERFSFVCKSRHRALGDTEILVHFSKQLEKDFTKENILNAVQNIKGSFTPPPNINTDVIRSLPNSSGVYSFLGKNGELLYIGKSKNIKTRVMSHFSGVLRDQKSKILWSETYDIDYKLTLTDFSAQLLEIFKIKTETPVYNRKLRRNERLWGLVKKKSSLYAEFSLEPINDKSLKNKSAIYSIFKTKSQGKKYLGILVKEYRLCPKLMGLEKSSGACFSYQLGLCDGACVEKIAPEQYNLKIDQIFYNKKLRDWPYKGEKIILNRSSESNLAERFVINNWILEKAEVYEEQDWSSFFNSFETYFDYDIYKVLIKYL